MASEVTILIIERGIGLVSFQDHLLDYVGLMDVAHCTELARPKIVGFQGNSFC